MSLPTTVAVASPPLWRTGLSNPSTIIASGKKLADETPFDTLPEFGGPVPSREIFLRFEYS